MTYVMGTIGTGTNCPHDTERANAQNLAAGKESLQKEVQDTKSELWEMQTKLTAKDEEVELERAKAQNLEEKVIKLQGALEQERLKHDAEMQHQSAETAQDTPLSSEAQHTRRAEHVVTDAGGQQASTINDSSAGEVTESQLTQTKGLEAIEQERDLLRTAESLQKQVDESRQSSKKDADELSQSLQAVTRERDFHQDKAESSQKELNELKRSLAQLLQARQS
jgi:chromosome segregation ATPase